jgi:hypothetical protein
MVHQTWFFLNSCFYKGFYIFGQHFQRMILTYVDFFKTLVLLKKCLCWCMFITKFEQMKYKDIKTFNVQFSKIHAWKSFPSDITNKKCINPQHVKLSSSYFGWNYHWIYEPIVLAYFILCTPKCGHSSIPRELIIIIIFLVLFF